MTPTEAKIARLVAVHSRKLDFEDIGPDTAMAQDALIDGIDVDDLVFDLERDFGSIVWEIPWGRFSDQRSSFRGCAAVALFPVWLVGRVIFKPKGEAILPIPDSTDLPRLTVYHIGKVIDQGGWSEPD